MDLQKEIAHLNEMRAWPDGWNGYNAQSPSGESIDHAIAWITTIAESFPHLIAPTFTTGDGETGVCFEWLCGRQFFTVCINEGVEYYADAALSAREHIHNQYRLWTARLTRRESRIFAEIALASLPPESALVHSLLQTEGG